MVPPALWSIIKDLKLSLNVIVPGTQKSLLKVPLPYNTISSIPIHWLYSFNLSPLFPQSPLYNIPSKIYKWDKVFNNGPSTICGRQPLKNLKPTIPLQNLSSTNLTWFILKYFVLDTGVCVCLFYVLYYSPVERVGRVLQAVSVTASRLKWRLWFHIPT